MITLTRVQVAAIAAALLAVLTVAGKRLAAGGTAEGSPGATQATRLAPGRPATAAAARLYIDVVGAVRRAGLYRLADGSRVADALARAGGATRRADLAAVNLAAPLVDGQQVVVPLRTGAGAGQSAASASTSGAADVAAKVSLSSASADQLDALPGIGPVTAQKIVAWRTSHGAFRSVDDLDAIPGIGPARIEQLRDLVTP